MKTWMVILILAICSSCSLSDRKSSSHCFGTQIDFEFDNYTLTQAIERVRDKTHWGVYSFKVRNDRNFEYLLFKKVIDRGDLLREIKSETHCEIHEAGNSVLIILPKLE